MGYNRRKYNMINNWHQCPLCGNTKTNTRIKRCNKCHTIFCDSCATKDFDHFPLPITSEHCPRCGSKDLTGLGGIWE